MLTGPNLIVAACVLSGVMDSSGVDQDFFSKVVIFTLPKIVNLITWVTNNTIRPKNTVLEVIS